MNKEKISQALLGLGYCLYRMNPFRSKKMILKIMGAMVVGTVLGVIIYGTFYLSGLGRNEVPKTETRASMKVLKDSKESKSQVYQADKAPVNEISSVSSSQPVSSSLQAPNTIINNQSSNSENDEGTPTPTPSSAEIQSTTQQSETIEQQRQQALEQVRNEAQQIKQSAQEAGYEVTINDPNN